MLIFAHRGSHNRKTSENTLVAFERALNHGVHGIEFDLRISRDQVPVAVHDENLHRVAGDARRVRDLTARELQAVLLRGEGCIPTLNDITSTVPSPIQFDIEVKDSDALELLIRKLKTSSNLRERTIVSSFVIEDLLHIRQEFPEMRTINLNMSWPLFLRKRKFLKYLKPADLWAVGFPGRSLNKKRIDWLRNRGFKVAAWDHQPLKREARRIARLNPDIAIVFKIEALKKPIS
ncbi:MAG: glycerophosphodiester phosphodiesterase family protein [Patescibacteria group bacterium]|nr:hypothetical protein [Patescibacteria group bacterium]